MFVLSTKLEIHAVNNQCSEKTQSLAADRNETVELTCMGETSW